MLLACFICYLLFCCFLYQLHEEDDDYLYDGDDAYEFNCDSDSDSDGPNTITIQFLWGDRYQILPDAELKEKGVTFDEEWERSYPIHDSKIWGGLAQDKSAQLDCLPRNRKNIELHTDWLK